MDPARKKQVIAGTVVGVIVGGVLWAISGFWPWFVSGIVFGVSYGMISRLPGDEQPKDRKRK